MIPAATVVQCLSKVQSSVDVNSLIQQGLISHPCDRKIKAVYEDIHQLQLAISQQLGHGRFLITVIKLTHFTN